MNINLKDKTCSFFSNCWTSPVVDQLADTRDYRRKVTMHLDSSCTLLLLLIDLWILNRLFQALGYTIGRHNITD
ncbi:VWFA domain-containing protein [Psidium guajava]|nr:VWFA domain-containing protein [Psidium guajava]